MHAFVHQLPTAFLQNLSPWELALILILALLLFGGKKLPELARGAGRAIKEFKDATSDAERTLKEALKETPEKPQASNRSAPTETGHTSASENKASQQS